jgi:hypothetical protein
MSAVPTPRDEYKVTRKRLKVGTKHILLTTHESKDSYILYFGGLYFYCLYAIISKLDSPMARYFNPERGSLPEVHYSVKCSLEENFRRGIDTTMLIRLAVSYIKKTYPHVKILSFNDASYRECDIGTKVELPELAMITTGKTWYETHFGAYPSQEAQNTLKRAKSKLKEIKDDLSWEKFKHVMFVADPLPDATLKAAYDKADTLQDFFLWLRGEIGVPEFCAFCAPWLHAFFMHAIGVTVTNLGYMLPIQDSPVEAVEYEESPFRGGGKRPTRRAPKRKYGNSI